MEVYACDVFENQNQRETFVDLLIRDLLDPEFTRALLQHIHCCDICGLFVDLLGIC